MKIEIKSMTLRNFKKVRGQEIVFSHSMLISGGNKVGKTTIYDAYLWAIFGITSKQKSVVQPLDANNEIVHHLETSVTVVLNYNDEREVKVQRILTENWKGRGTADERLQSTTQERLINDVPLSQKAFNEKLEELCPLNKWLMLSNVGLFMSNKIDDRRKMLMSLAGEINEEELMKPYPFVYKGVLEEKKELSDILLQQTAIKKKADEELKLIPAKVQAQEVLRVTADFEALKSEKDNIDNTIRTIDAALEGTAEKDPEMEEYLAKLQAYNIKITNAQKMWQDTKIKDVDDLTRKTSEALNALSVIQSTYAGNFDAYNKTKVKLRVAEMNFKNKIQEWNNANEKEFGFDKTDVCPVCGRPYTDEMKEAEFNNAVAEFNKNKSETLARLQNEASEIKQQIAVLKGEVNTYEQITKPRNENDVRAAKETHRMLREQREERQNQSWELSCEKIKLDEEFSQIEAIKPVIKVDVSVEENKNKKAVLLARRDEITKLLAGEEINKRIEAEKKKLDGRSVELAQIITNSSEFIRQIKAYKKEKITLIEEKVNAYFSLVHWKFYAQNKTNDDEKEICTPVDKDGVDYDNTNDGMVINMGVDIIGGISKASNIFVPLFIDRKESAEEIVPIQQQAIFLQCVYGQPLSIGSI